MRIKYHQVMCLALILADIFFVSCKTDVPVNEIFITTGSKEALKYFIAGRDEYENAVFEVADSLLEKAIQLDSNFAMAYLYRFRSEGGTKALRINLIKAESLVNKVSEGEKYLILYYSARAEDDIQKQKEYLDKLLKSFPVDKRVHIIAGQFYDNLENYSNSLIHYKKSVELDKNFAPAYKRLGYCQSELDNDNEAEKAFLSYIGLAPDRGDPYDSYAEFLLNAGRFDESIEQYKKVLETDPVGYVNSTLWIGNNYIFKGNYETARKYYQDYSDQATGISGKLRALYFIATSYVHEGKTENALKTFDEFRTLAEKNNLKTVVVFSYVDEACILRESGRPADALRYSAKAIAIAKKLPVTDPSRELLVTVATTIDFEILAVNNELDKAIAEAENCRLRVESRKNPAEEMQLNHFLGRLELNKGNYARAIEYFDKGGEGDPQGWYYNALAYKKQGEMEKASRLFEKIKQCRNNSLTLAFARNLMKRDLNQSAE